MPIVEDEVFGEDMAGILDAELAVPGYICAVSQDAVECAAVKGVCVRLDIAAIVHPPQGDTTNEQRMLAIRWWAIFVCLGDALSEAKRFAKQARLGI